jgi:5-methylcytosine-specific restriction endonuclease McrA
VSAVSDRGALAFVEKLLTLLGEGSFTATYKYAVILGLMDLCLEHSTRTGDAPSSVTTPQLAEKILELYWPHAMPYQEGRVLRQNAGGQARILSYITRFREHHAPDSSMTLNKARMAAPSAYARLAKQIEWKLVQMPLPKLQRIGSGVHAFLYQIAWGDDVRKRDFASDEFDNLIRFVGESSGHLVRLAGLLRPFVQREWAGRIARLNKDLVQAPELEDFLFGADRISLEPIRSDLNDLQSGRCFYCADRMPSGSEVDHFIPWARYPDDGIENLVLAHSRCNHAKRDHLAATEHVLRWALRASEHARDLEEISKRRTWVRHRDRTLSVARSIYLGLPEDARLWRIEGEFVVMDRGRLTEAFSRI